MLASHMTNDGLTPRFGNEKLRAPLHFFDHFALPHPSWHTSTMTDPQGKVIDLDEILQLAIKAARLAGAEIRRVTRGSDSTMETVIKSDTTDLVTARDQHCEALVTDCIRQRFPQHAIIGEEASGADCQYTLTDAPT